MQGKEKAALLSKLASKVMRDRQLLQMLGDKVYELMLEELRLKKERNKN
jgi:hypothetical protein